MTEKQKARKVEVRIRAKAQNAILAKLADDHGSTAAAAKAIGVGVATLLNWIAFRSAIGGTCGGFSKEKRRSVVIELEKQTGRNIRDIFPLTKEQMREISQERVYERTIDTEALLGYQDRFTERLTYTPPDLDADDRKLAVAALVDTLSTKREQEIVKMHFGIGYDRSYNFEEIGNTFKITRERVRQIEAKALRMFQMPSRAQTVVQYDDTTDRAG